LSKKQSNNLPVGNPSRICHYDNKCRTKVAGNSFAGGQRLFMCGFPSVTAGLNPKTTNARK
jgi:hypothetical protein